MGLLSNRVERSEIKAGDHIYSWRTVYTYSHHGVYVGGEKVVHFTRKKETSSGIDSSGSSGTSSKTSSSINSFDSSGTSSKTSSSINSFDSSGTSSACPTFPDCGFQQPNSGVILSCLDCFLGKGSLYQFEYGVPPSLFLAKFRGGTCTTAISDSPPTVIHRAMYLLQNGFGNYDVFENNCEDFALYCKTGLLPVEDMGIGRSGQASSILSVPLAAICSSSFKLLAAGPVGIATVTAGMYCANRYVTDIGVRKDVMKVAVEDLAVNLGWRRLHREVTEETGDDGGEKLSATGQPTSR